MILGIGHGEAGHWSSVNSQLCDHYYEFSLLRLTNDYWLMTC